MLPSSSLSLNRKSFSANSHQKEAVTSVDTLLKSKDYLGLWDVSYWKSVVQARPDFYLGHFNRLLDDATDAHKSDVAQDISRALHYPQIEAGLAHARGEELAVLKGRLTAEMRGHFIILPQQKTIKASELRIAAA